MLLVDMLERVHRALGDRARDILDDEITKYLNTVWQFQIPDILPGFLREETFFPLLVIGTKLYDVDTHADFGGRCRSLTHEFFDSDGVYLRYHTDQRTFYNQFAPNDYTRGTPTDVLVRGREFTLGPTPDTAFRPYVSAIAYSTPLTDDGLTNDNHAFMVVRGAIRDIAGDLGYEEIFQRFAGLFDQSVRRSANQTLSRPTSTIRQKVDF